MTIHIRMRSHRYKRGFGERRSVAYRLRLSVRPEVSKSERHVDAAVQNYRSWFATSPRTKRFFRIGMPTCLPVY